MPSLITAGELDDVTTVITPLLQNFVDSNLVAVPSAQLLHGLFEKITIDFILTVLQRKSL